MQHLFFWLQILSIIICSISFFSSLIAYHNKENSWQKAFAFLLFSLSLLMIDYTIFYFINLYLTGYIAILTKVYMFSVFVILSYIIYSMLLFVIQIIEIKNTRIIKKIIYSIFIIMFIIFIPAILLWNKILLLCGGILYGFIIGNLIIYLITKFKKLNGKGQKIIIISILFILILSMVEYFFRIKEFTNSSYLPLGLFSFVSYLIIMNLIFLIKNIYIIFNTENSNIDFSDDFIKKYSITTREKDIIKLLIKGKSHKQIGGDLFISTRTVNRHVYNIYQKCDVKTLIELINIIK